MIICSYHLTTSADRRDALLTALAALARALEGRTGFAGAVLLRAADDANRLRFEETWHSAAAHEAAMDPTLKAALKAVMAGVVEPVAASRFEPQPWP